MRQEGFWTAVQAKQVVYPRYQMRMLARPKAARRGLSGWVRACVRDELRHPLFQNPERHRAERQNRIVERPLVELRAELLFRFAAVPADLDLAELVGERLGWPGDVALHLGGDFVLRQRARPRRYSIARSRDQPN
jgi:hypothetical protein